MSRTTAIPAGTGRALASLLVAGSAFLATTATAQGDVQVHGFVSQGYLHSSEYNYFGHTDDGSLEFAEYGVNFSSQLSDELRVGVQLFARDLGDLGNNEVELDWAFGDYRLRDWFGLRVGRVKMPYGLYNEYSDYDMTRTSVLLPQGVYDSRFRDLMVAVNGVSSYGSVELGAAGSLDYQAFIGTSNIPADGSVGAYFDDATVDYQDPGSGEFRNIPLFALDRVDSKHTGGGQAIWTTPVEGLRLGYTLGNNAAEFHVTQTVEFNALLDFQFSQASQAMGGGPIDVPRTQAYDLPRMHFGVLSAEYQRDRFTFAGEWSRWVGTFNNLYDDATSFAGTPLANSLDFELDMERWYVQASARVHDRLELGSYYSVFYSDRGDKDGSRYDYGAQTGGALASRNEEHRAWQKDLTVSVRIDITDSMILKLENHFINGTAGLLHAENPGVGSILPGGEEESWMLFAAKTSFIF